MLTADENRWLETMSGSTKEQRRHVVRAAVMLGYANGETISSLAERLRLTRKSVGKWVDRALEVGVYAAIEDAPHGASPKITEAAKAWALSVACQKPKDLGYAAEVWSRSALAAHLRKNAGAAGHPSLASAAKATVQRLLREHALQPQKVAYYLDRRDPEFDRKMAEVVAIYTEVATDPPADTVTISVDEKPGVQAIANTAPDLPPAPHRHAAHARDHEYKVSVRAGTY